MQHPKHYASKHFYKNQYYNMMHSLVTKTPEHYKQSTTESMDIRNAAKLKDQHRQLGQKSG